jgi:hypothetical protein
VEGRHRVASPAEAVIEVAHLQAAVSMAPPAVGDITELPAAAARTAAAPMEVAGHTAAATTKSGL